MKPGTGGRFFAAAALMWLALAIVAARGLASWDLWLDEIMAVKVAMSPTVEGVLQSVPKDKPPLDYLVMHAVSKTGGPVWSYRIPSFIWFLATSIPIGLCAACVLWGRPIQNRWAAAIVAALLWLSQPTLRGLAIYALPYSQLNFWIATTAALILSGSVTGKKKHFGLAAVSGFFACATAFTAVFHLLALAALMMVIVWRADFKGLPNGWLRVGFTGVIVLAWFVPLIMCWERLRSVAGAPVPWKFQRGVEFVKLMGEVFSGAGRSMWVGIGLVSLECVVVAASMMRRPVGERGRIVGVILWAAAATGMLLFVFWKQDHWLATRYLSTSLVPWTIVMGAAMGRMLDAASASRAAKVSMAVVAGLLMARIGLNFTSTQLTPSYRDVAESIARQQPTSNDVVVVDNDVTRYCLGFYLTDMRIDQLPVIKIFDPSMGELDSLASGSGRLFVPNLVFDGAVLDERLKERMANDE